MTVLLGAPAQAQDRPTPSAADIEQARKHMKAGAAFANDPSGQRKCEEALREFSKAYELSGSLNALKAMAICNLELERDGDAIERYQAYLAGKGGSLEAGEKAQIEADLNALKEAVARVKLGANLPGARVTDVRTPAKGSPIRNAYPLAVPEGPALGIHPGEHVFTASLEGYPDQSWRTEIANGGTYAHVFTFKHEATPDNLGLPPPPVMVRPTPAGFWVMGGLTVALTAPWAVLAVRAKQKHDAYDRVNGKETEAQLAPIRAGVVHANTLADIFLGAAAASLVTTVIVYLARPTRPATVAPPGALYVGPSVGMGGGGAVLGGSF